VKSYPKRIYLSATWKGDDRAATVQLANLITKLDVTVVRDHERNKNGDPLKKMRTWAKRVDAMLQDCSGLIAVLPFNSGNPQTTSPFLIPELLAADQQGIPILLFANPGVMVNTTLANNELQVSFPNAGTGTLLRAADILPQPPDQEGLLESRLIGAGGFVLKNSSNLTGVLPYPNQQNHRATAAAIEDFIGAIADRDPYPFVFNILPFSLKDSIHQVIATEVFKATGMACHISLDSVSGEVSVRRNWEIMLQRSDLIIAELSSLRDTCLFETGCAIGLKKQVFVVSKKGQGQLPFGLDDQAFYQYESDDDLARHVREVCCNAHRREVFNLSEDFKKLENNPSAPHGIPKWLGKRAGFGLDARLTLAIWAIFLSLAFLVQIVVIRFWGSSTPNMLAICSALSGFLSLTRVGREFWEKKIGKWLGWLPWAALLTMLCLIVALILLIT
jgi:hypothetical protein